ncbi:hypothetical protein N308_08304, partial [Struthio camelus australis]
MTAVCTVTSPTVLQSSAGVTEGQWDMKAQTCYRSKRLSSRELPLGESKLTFHTKLLLSVFKAELVNLLDSSQVSEDRQTEIHVSYKYTMSAGGRGGERGRGDIKRVQGGGGERKKRHLTFPALERTVLTPRNKSLELFNSLRWLMPH